MRSVESNIWKMYLFKAFRWSMILLPVVVLFFQDLGLSMKQIFLLQSIFAWAVVFLEIPTGYFGDMLRRKDGLIIGAFCWLIWWVLYHFAVWFRSIAIAEIALALAYTFYSWSDTALLYDSLQQTWRSNEFKKIKGRYLAMGNFSEWIWALLWGRLAMYWFGIITSIQVYIAIFCLAISFTLVEPIREKYLLKEAWIGHIVGVIKDAMKWGSLVSSIVVYSAFTGVSTMFWVWLAQPYFTLVELPLLRFGILRGIGNISVWLFSLLAYRLESRFSNETLLLSFPFFVVVAYLLLWTFPSFIVLAVGLVFYAVRWVSTVVYMDLINKEISSKERATILSVKSLAFRFVFMILGPIVWWIVDGHWILIGMYSAWALTAIMCLIGRWILKKNLSKI